MPKKIKLQVRQGDQPSYPIQDRIFVAHGGSRMPCAPALLLLRKGEERRKKKREVLHLFRCYTHTHKPGRSRVNPERQEEEKSGHRRRANDQNSEGGGREQTDLRNQPTGRNGPDKKQGTHLNPTTHYGEAARGGQLGTKWGTSW